ncbi:MAG: heparan-alpha-glucosaminide N-acetyltransferase domain-containing protein [Candidatus Gracilibacteria bacterium]
MKGERITSYDVFRGLLLVGMVIFHLIVNLSNLEFDQNYFYWVPLGFMLFLGVILGKFLGGKSKKIVILGIKLAAIFLILNIPNFISKDYTPAQLIIGDQRIISFEILLPMSIMTFISIGLNKIVKNYKTALITSLALLSALTYLYLINIYSYNLSFLIYGIIGYLIGKNLDLDNISKKISNKTFIVVILAALIPFLVIGHAGIVEILIILQVLALYFLTAKIFDKNKFLTVLGKHSLFLYIFHVVLIKTASYFYKIQSIVPLIIIIPLVLFICFMVANFSEKRELKI